mgnify:FL=1
MKETPFLRRLLALTRKEFLQIRRDRGSILLGVVLPLVLILIIGYGLSLDVKNVRTAVVLEDSSPTARETVRFLDGSDYFAPAYVHARSEAEAMMRRGEVDAMLVVPADFSRNLSRGTAQLELLLNGIEATTAASAQGYFEAVVLQEAARRGAAQRFGHAEVVSRVWFNDANTSTWFFVPGLLMLVLTIVGVFLTAVVMAREWERGTFESLFVTPVQRLELILAKMIPYFLIAMTGMLLCLLTGRLLYDLPMRGSLVLILGTAMLYLIMALGLGLVISALTKSQFLACQMALFLSFLPSVMLSGFLYDLHTAPLIIRLVSSLLPMTYFLQLLKSLLLTGDYTPLIVRNTTILAGFAALFVGAALHLTRKKVGE